MVTADLSEVSNLFILQHEAASPEVLSLADNYAWMDAAHSAHAAKGPQAGHPDDTLVDEMK